MTTKKIKMVTVGDGAVGKTSMLMSYATGKFPKKYVPTVFDNHVVIVTCGDDIIELTLWDTGKL